MINEKSLQAVQSGKFSKNFGMPLYSSYCFSRIPQTVEKLFFPSSVGALPEDTYAAGPYDHVVLLFLDAFGWRFFEEFREELAPLRKIENEGIVSKITSMFPSTTAAHVTCIHTGLMPVQTGIYEWFIYEPKVDGIIAPLPFSYAGERGNETLPLDPKDLFPKETLYHRLSEHQIACNCFESSKIAQSSYSSCILAGSTVHGYKKAGQGLEALASTLQNHQKSYSFFYYGDIDAIGHRKGIHSNEFKETVRGIWDEIGTLIERLPPKTALLITADHGMVEVKPDTTIYLNKKIPNIAKYLKFGRKDKPLAPAGSCRDLFFHAHPESLAEFKEILEIFLEGKAEVYTTEELLEAGLFGPSAPSEKFKSRVGNLVVTPYKGEAVWWFERNHFQQNFFGAHGGLTREELEIPFLFYSRN